MATTPLNSDEVQAALADLPGWRFDNDRLKKTFRFSNFKEAMCFMVRAGFEAEKLGHHPELFNVYSTVEIALTTHDAGNRVSHKDVSLAESIEAFAWV